MNKIARILSLTLLGVFVASFALLAQDIPMPTGDTIGTSTDYTKDSFTGVMNTLFAIGLGLVNWGLVALSYYFPKLKGIKVLKLDNPHVRVVLTSVIILAGFFAKFQDTGAWLSFVAQNFELPFLASGLYELVTKKIFGKSKIEKTNG